MGSKQSRVNVRGSTGRSGRSPGYRRQIQGGVGWGEIVMQGALFISKGYAKPLD